MSPEEMLLYLETQFVREGRFHFMPAELLVACSNGKW